MSALVVEDHLGIPGQRFQVELERMWSVPGLLMDRHQRRQWPDSIVIQGESQARHIENELTPSTRTRMPQTSMIKRTNWA